MRGSTDSATRPRSWTGKSPQVSVCPECQRGPGLGDCSVQGMETAVKSLKVFMDVVALRAGEYWETELRNRISNTDAFYLLCCRHAKE